MSYPVNDVERTTKRAVNQTARDRRIFAANLARLMDEKKLNQVQLAERTGLSVSYISMLVRNCREPVLLTQNLLANGLQVKRADLMSDPTAEQATED